MDVEEVRARLRKVPRGELAEVARSAGMSLMTVTRFRDGTTVEVRDKAQWLRLVGWATSGRVGVPAASVSAIVAGAKAEAAAFLDRLAARIVRAHAEELAASLEGQLTPEEQEVVVADAVGRPTLSRAPKKAQPSPPRRTRGRA